MRPGLATVSELAAAGASASATIEVAGMRHRVSFVLAGGRASSQCDPFVPISLLPAMRVGGALRIREPVSPRLLSAVPKIQQLLEGWRLGFRKVRVEAVTREGAPAPSRRGVGSFFSGGVDSFYTVLRHREELTHLVYVDGLEHRTRPEVARALHQAAAELGKPLLEVSTDLVSYSSRYVSWSYFHGAGLAAVALFLSPLLGRVYLASGLGRDSFPYGSHPALDPLWSTEETEIVHDGWGVSRNQKVAAISADDVAMRWLRVCGGRYGTYNCGRCEKCHRTMVNLYLAGALGRCRTLPDSLDLEAISRLVVRPTARSLWEENLQAARRGQDAPLVRALRGSLRHHYVRRSLGAVKRRMLPSKGASRVA